MDTSILDTKRLILIKGGKLAHLYANGYLPSAEKTFVTFFQRKKKRHNQPRMSTTHVEYL